MCGIFGLATIRGRQLSVRQDTISRMRDRLARRGPDDAGLWLDDNIALAHRRLAIQDPQHGQQPMVIGTPAPGTPGHNNHFIITYNGELYNHHELRYELEQLGRRFQTNCDTETVLHAFAQWGPEAFTRFRGMFALAIYHPESHTLTLARDPLGIKPLYYAIIDTPAGREFVFASEPVAILDHPHMSRQPDWTVVSSYLTTIRTTLGSRSMFEGINVVLPGEMIQVDLSRDELEIRKSLWHDEDDAGTPCEVTFDEAAYELNRLIEQSVHAHLISDVPTCALLSGGLDSSIISLLATDSLEHINTYCAGALIFAEDNDDFAFARVMARQIGSDHVDVPVRMKEFQERWPWMISELGIPLSTPNEVAIYLAAQRMSEDAKVTLSGEGADEFFAGYEVTICRAAKFFADHDGDTARATSFFLDTQAWVPLASKVDVLTPDMIGKADDDATLHDVVSKHFTNITDYESGMRAYLHAQQSFNLAGLLSRLDTSTMLASVEGRTPLADRVIARFARQLPFDYLFADVPADNHCTVVSQPHAASSTATVTACHAKRILRQAFAYRLPAEIVDRPKASFPLPFEYWMSNQAEALPHSSMAKEIFTPKAIRTVAENPAGNWSLAWPILNLSLWLETHWG
ncbi:MAG: asparagine synthase (glutamine-hydrolyzing) [Planctomycetes bacterium]|nr:asparagine synthase (glutamine-hydrolyzing) [Planctomycetota bacterium]